jgi:hypothetical protein
VLGELRASIPRQGDGYDWVILNAAAKRVKERYPASKTMILVPDDSMRYELIVKIMDAVRDQRLPSGQKIELFTEVVMSSTPASETK